MGEKTDSQKRLASLDALRGFDMFFIMGGDALFLSLGALFPGTFFEVAGRQMMHTAWHGFTFEDLIFPLFLFLAGVSFPFSLAARGDAGMTKRILRRGILLVLLGMVYNGLLQFDFDTLRCASVLGRIGLAWMIAALLFMRLGRKACITVAVAVLLGYWALLALVPAPDGGGASCFSMRGCLVGYVDRLLLPGTLHDGIHDPEGILSTLPAVVTALLGMFTGDFVRSAYIKNGFARVGVLLIAAALLAGVGLLWDILFPINKNLWTSSFVCLAGGISVALFALFHLVTDVVGLQGWAFFFKVIGMNSITIYMAQRFVDFSFTQQRLFGGAVGLLPASWHGVASACMYILLCWLFLFFLYRQKIFLKV